MIETIQRICGLQPYYTPDNTPEMQERGELIRSDLAAEVRALEPTMSAALGRFGSDFHVDASDGIGRKTETPWVRFCSRSMAPDPTGGFYGVIHFATDGSAVFVTVGCGSSKYRNGSFVRLPNKELDSRTSWIRRVVREGAGSIEPFTDQADFGARRPLPKSFERATALAKRIAVEDLERTDFEALLVRAAEYLKLIYEAETEGRDLSPADQDELEIEKAIRPLSKTGRQGYGLSAADRRKVEMQAMRVATEWLEQHGYHVKDTSANHSYDLEATDGEEVLKVEVKGTTSDNPDAVLMTHKEVELHRSEKGRTALFIVSGIRLESDGNEKVARGGEIETLLGWDIDQWQLTATAYRVARR